MDGCIHLVVYGSHSVKISTFHVLILFPSFLLIYENPSLIKSVFALYGNSVFFRLLFKCRHYVYEMF